MTRHVRAQCPATAIVNDGLPREVLATRWSLGRPAEATKTAAVITLGVATRIGKRGDRRGTLFH